MTNARREVTAVMHLPQLESGQSWCCSNGCGTCTPVLSNYEYSRHEDLYGQLIESKTQHIWLSSCCHRDLMLWDESKQDFIEGWERMEPISHQAASVSESPAAQDLVHANPPSAKVIPLVLRTRPRPHTSLMDRILSRVPEMPHLSPELRFYLFLMLAVSALGTMAWLFVASAPPHVGLAGPVVASPVTGVRWHAAATSVAGQGTTTIDTRAGAVEVAGLVPIEPGATATLRFVPGTSGLVRQLCVATASRAVCHPVVR